MSGYEVPHIWRLKQYKGIEVQRCPHCDYVSVRRRPVCLNCGDEAKNDLQQSQSFGVELVKRENFVKVVV